MAGGDAGDNGGSVRGWDHILRFCAAFEEKLLESFQ